MQIVNLALEAGRSLQKKQTGYLHYCYQSKDLTTHDTIPIFENALFALALFRTRLSDHVLEGKEILEKLLAFEVKGNFPVYLHEYPQKNDPFVGLRLLPIFFWICHDFSHVIGELRQKLEACIDRIIANVKRDSLPDWATMRLLAMEGKIGPLPTTEFDWGEALISLQIAEKKGASIEEAMQKASENWHSTLFFYKGESGRWNQEKGEIKQSLFSLFMHAFQKSNKQLSPDPLHLKAALVRPLSFALDFQKMPDPYIAFHPKGEAPLFIAWKGEGITHSFVFAKKHLQISGTAEEFIISYPEEKQEDGLEASFFLNYHQAHEILVNGKKASAFQIGDQVEIRSQGVRITLQFTAENGRFFGHLLRGNRPSQHGCKGKDHFAAFDWQIALRTISRGPNASIRMRALFLKMPANPQPLPLHASHYPHKESSQ